MRSLFAIRYSTFFIAALVSSALTARVQGDPARGIQWPSFRGPNATGVAEGFTAPTTWNVETGDHVKWKTPIPGLGHSSPVVWADRIYVTTAVPASGEAALKVGLYGDPSSVDEDSPLSWRVYCLDKKSGKVLWEREAHQGVPKTKRHPKSTHANPTPVTDGTYVVAFFGSAGLYCYTMDGELVWKKDLGVLDDSWAGNAGYQWGFSSSPVLHDGHLYIQCDILKDSFLTALDLKNGHEIWRTPRDDDPTWSTPTVYVGSGRPQILCNGYKHIGGYDAESGKEVWRMKGGGDVPVPAPVVAHDLIFITNAHGDEAPIYAVRPTATGDITLPAIGDSNEHIAWSRSKRGNYMQTPLVYGDYLYTCKDNGSFTAYEARTGKQTFRERIGGGNTGFTASIVAADGKLYVTSEEGDVYVFQAGAEYKPLAKNAMGEICMATPAISEGVLIFRTQRHVVAIGEKREQKSE